MNLQEVIGIDANQTRFAFLPQTAGRRFSSFEEGTNMFKSILVPGLNAACNETALELGVKVARLFDGHIDCLHVHPDSRELARHVPVMDARAGTFTGQIWDSRIASDKMCASKSRKTFDAFCAGEHIGEKGAVTASWCEAEGNALDQTIVEAYYHDLVVFARPNPPEDLTTMGVGDVLVECGRPLLLAPSTKCPNPLSTIVIAWKDMAASAHAVTAAIPLLKKAETIHVLCVAESDGDDQSSRASVERMANYLRRHGLKVQAGQIHANGRNVCDVLLREADTTLHAGLLVMGGYGHSRAREFIFGGFTRQVLLSAPIPVFLSH